MKLIDRSVYIVGFIGNAAVIPQIIKAWSGPAPGLAISTWALFSFGACIWLAYAYMHRYKPLIVTQAVCLLANLAVVTGWLVNNL